MSDIDCKHHPNERNQMSGYYPEGVTGAELAIAGPDSEKEATRETWCRNRECEDYNVPQEIEGDEWTHGGEVFFDWTCPECSKWHQDEDGYLDPMGYHPDL
jgi:hypothetical protein